MTYSKDLCAAARRHLQAADVLFNKSSHKAVSGYLYGIAAECAVKVLMEQAGMRPLNESQRRDDPFFAHFPELRTMLRDQSPGRIGQHVRNLIEDDRFMNQWNTKMRYAPGPNVRSDWVNKWREQAHQAVDCIDT